MSKPLNIGMIGYGFMGRAHSNAYRQVSQFFQREYQPVLKACCARNEDKIKAFAANWGYESYETDWRKLIERKDIDLIDIGSPNNTHNEIVLAAAKAGKMILCEKPLAMNVAEGEEMCRRGRKGRRAQHGLVQLSPRAGHRPGQAVGRRRPHRPAVSLSRHVPARLDHRRDVPQGGAALWRLDAAVAGSGVTGDLLAHSIDTAEWLNGPIAPRCRPRPKPSSRSACTPRPARCSRSASTTPACSWPCSPTARWARSRAPATPAAARTTTPSSSTARPAASSSIWKIRSILQYFKYTDPKTGAKIDSHLTGWRKIHVTNPEHPYMKQLVGAGLHDRLRAHVHQRPGRFPGRAGDGQAGAARLPLRPADAKSLRRGAGERKSGKWIEL